MSEEAVRRTLSLPALEIKVGDIIPRPSYGIPQVITKIVTTKSTNGMICRLEVDQGFPLLLMPYEQLTIIRWEAPPVHPQAGTRWDRDDVL